MRPTSIAFLVVVLAAAVVVLLWARARPEPVRPGPARPPPARAMAQQAPLPLPAPSLGPRLTTPSPPPAPPGVSPRVPALVPREDDLRQAVDRAFAPFRAALTSYEVRCTEHDCQVHLHLDDVATAGPAIEALLEPDGLARPGLVAVLSGGPPNITVTIAPAP
jgi:hypothetical protein